MQHQTIDVILIAYLCATASATKPAGKHFATCMFLLFANIIVAAYITVIGPTAVSYTCCPW